MSFSDYFNQVQDLYIAYYQRPVDPAGLIYWSQMANQAGGLTPQIVNAFATSQEAQDNYGTITPANIGTVINDIYEALFNRSADPSDLQFYENGFDNGTFTAGTIALNILNGAQGNDSLTLNNKLTAAMQFTQALDSGNASQLTATYDSADTQLAKSYLSDVTSNLATLYTAAQTTGYIAQHIASYTDPVYINNNNFGYYDFTTGIDHLVGTSPIINIFEGTLGAYGYNLTIQPGDSASGYSGTTNTLQIVGNDSGIFPLGSLGLTNIQNVSISGDNYGLDFTNTSGIQNLISTAANGYEYISGSPYSGVLYTLNGQNVTINDTVGYTFMELSGTFGNVSLNNDSGVIYNLDNTGTAPTATNLAIDNIGSSISGDTLSLTGISALDLSVSGTNYLSSGINGDSSLTTLNITAASGALLEGETKLDAPSLTTLNIAGASDIQLFDVSAVSALSTVNAAQDAGSLYLDFTALGTNTGTIASGFTFTGGTSPSTELVFTSSMLSGSFGTVTQGSGANILGINDGATPTSIDSSGTLVNTINGAFAGFNTLDILTASGSSINASLLTHIDNYYVDNAGTNIIGGLTSSDAVSIFQGSNGVALGLSSTDQTLHVNIGGDSTFHPTTGLTVDWLSTMGDYNVILNSYGSDTNSNTIPYWNYASTGLPGSTADHNITIGGNYDLTASLLGTFGSASQTSALNITNVFNASSFDGVSVPDAPGSTYHLNIIDATIAIGNISYATTVNNLFIAPTNTTMSLTDHAFGGTSSTVNVYFDVHNAAYGNLAGGLVDSFALSGTNTHGYLLFDTNAAGSGASVDGSFGAINTPITVTGTTLAQDLTQIDNLNHANTLYQFSYGGSNYIVDTGASASTINDDIVVLIGTASAVGNSVTLASVNATQYHAVAV